MKRAAGSGQGERNPFRLSVTGIDGAGKDTITKLMLQKASADFDVIKLGRPAYAFTDGLPNQIYRRTTEGIDRLHQFGDRHYNPHFVTAANALNVLVQSRILERHASKRNPTPDIIASSRDPRVDPAVYFSFYGSPLFSRNVGMEQRLSTMQRLTNVERNLIVLLKVDPRVAVERIDARVEEEARIKAESGQASAGMRDKSRHIHENVEDLTALASGYDHALSALQEVRSTAVVEIDVTERPIESVTNLAYLAVQEVMNGNISLGEHLEFSEAA
jgi:thymidylate kinase